MLTIENPGSATEVLLVHAPYPVRPRFDGLPSSLLHAASKLAERLDSDGRLSALGLLDPGHASTTFDADLDTVLQQARLRVVAVSTSTAAIEETAAIVRLVRAARGDEVLVIVGGPHEDVVSVKTALRIPGVDLSIAGDGEFVLEKVVTSFLSGRSRSPRRFVSELPGELRIDPDSRGRFAVSSPWWGSGGSTVEFDRGSAPVAMLGRRPTTSKEVRFAVFDELATVPLLVSRGCSYGKCSFCTEAMDLGPPQVLSSFDHVRETLEGAPNAALYFQDSIFPKTAAVRSALLPLLRESGRSWGAQVYLGTLTRAWVDELARSGCRYLYTGLESGDSEVLSAIGKRPLNDAVMLERLSWISDAGLRVGISLMFGSMAQDGRLVENEHAVDRTVNLARGVVSRGISVAGFYPNVMTVLPGSALSRGLEANGVKIDFYRMPRTELFVDLEDGPVGYNFLSLAAPSERRLREDLGRHIVQACYALESAVNLRRIAKRDASPPVSESELNG